MKPVNLYYAEHYEHEPDYVPPENSGEEDHDYYKQRGKYYTDRCEGTTQYSERKLRQACKELYGKGFLVLLGVEEGKVCQYDSNHPRQDAPCVYLMYGWFAGA